MGETWKPIDFMGKCSDGRWRYQVSDFGRVMSFAQKKCGRVVSECVRGSVRLGAQQFLISELVAYAFIPNPYDWDYVRHLDGNKQNNYVSNLDWSPCSENDNSRVVRQYTLSGDFVASYFSVAEAERKTGIKYNKIWASCSRCATDSEFHWRYADDDEIAQGVVPETHIDKRLLLAGPPVRQYSLSGEFLQEYSSLRQATQLSGVDRALIVYCCERINSTAGGYTWRYLDADDIAETGVVPLPKTSKRAVRQYDLTGLVVEDYQSLSEAAETVGCSSTNIVNCCKRSCKTCAGFVWRYVDDDEFDNGRNLDGFTFSAIHKYRIKSVRQYRLDGNDVKFVAEYTSALDAAEKTGMNRWGIYAAINNRRGKSTAGEYIWKYVDNDPFAQYSYLGDELLKLYSPERSVRKYYGLQFVEEYGSLAEAATALGKDSSGIALACVGALTGYAGFNWKFV